jgi:gamma-glutamylcyclotransferase (GGCT)/AIG2-like uncharacterized protein YtfP
MEFYFKEIMSADNATQYPVLVYGTLRPGCGNYTYCLQGRTVFEQDVTLNGFVMHSNGGFPYLVDGEGSVTATLAYLNPDAAMFADTMEGLDGLEGFYGEGNPMNHYDRRLIDFESDGLIGKAWIYIASERAQERVKELPVIESGDWLEFQAEQRALRIAAGMKAY